jgi:hypothetical protein
VVPALCVSNSGAPGTISPALLRQIQSSGLHPTTLSRHEPTATADLPQASTTTSAGAAFTRSVLLFMGEWYARGGVDNL